MTIGGEKADHGSSCSGNRAGSNTDLTGNSSTSHSTFRTHAGVVRHFIDHGEDRIYGIARTGEKREEEADNRSNDCHIFRVGANDASGKADKNVQTADGFHAGCAHANRQDDEHHVNRRRSRHHAENHGKDEQTGTAPETQSNAAKANA